MNFIIKIFLIVFVLASLPMASEVYANSPKDIVETFCHNDSDGLGLSSNSWNEIKLLTSWEEAPGWDSAIIINNYKIIPLQVKEDSAEVKVIYNNIGELYADQFIFYLSDFYKIQATIYKLTEINGHWKIKSPQLPPHIKAKVAIGLINKKIKTGQYRQDDFSSLLEFLSNYSE